MSAFDLEWGELRERVGDVKTKSRVPVVELRGEKLSVQCSIGIGVGVDICRRRRRFWNAHGLKALDKNLHQR